MQLTSSIRSHSFRLVEYLNGTPKGKLDGVSKYSEIMSQLGDLFQQNTGYRLYVTGHSLGASLAQLFAMVRVRSWKFWFLLRSGYVAEVWSF